MKEITTIPNSTIEWNADRNNINFKDREAMEALTKCYERMITPQTIIDALEKLADGL